MITGEAVGTATKSGAITAFSLLGAPSAGTELYVGMPYGPGSYGALHALPLSNVTAGGTDAAITTARADFPQRAPGSDTQNRPENAGGALRSRCVDGRSQRVRV
ncbi:hypothetical protein [Streptomyces collinus]|uniref:hypothetical protein n=1 Tax=Streptomyces collinus TaxID=42684 RepID=UPI0029439467|nr:hypothetical protein [Streptomyces collinus]